MEFQAEAVGRFVLAPSGGKDPHKSASAFRSKYMRAVETGDCFYMLAGMGRRPNPTKSFARIDIRLEPDIADQIQSYHSQLVAAGIGGFPTDTIRELLLLGLGCDVKKVIVESDRMRAYNEVRWWMYHRIRVSLVEILAQLRDVEMANGRFIVDKDLAEETTKALLASINSEK